MPRTWRSESSSGKCATCISSGKPIPIEIGEDKGTDNHLGFKRQCHASSSDSTQLCRYCFSNVSNNKKHLNHCAACSVYHSQPSGGVGSRCFVQASSSQTGGDGSRPQDKTLCFCTAFAR
mmetsp:Transcript_7787/g.13473  ORF Transcript_7787/g.13473 Transcript_7787/m.13473 type:complete len:120 (-) Transcript_7787:101-460(-)